MNGYKLIGLTGDFAHLFSILFLLFSILIRKSCYGVSAKSQILFLMVYLSKYSDLFVNVADYFNTSLRVTYITTSLITCFIILVIYRKSYQREEDSVGTEIAVFGCFVIAIFNTSDLGPTGMMWSFSQSLEALAVIPQFFLIFNTKKVAVNVLIYLSAMGVYRVFSCLDWIYHYTIQDRDDLMVDISKFTFVGLFLFVLYSLVLYCNGVEIERDRHFIRQNIFLISQNTMMPERNIEKELLIID